MVVCLAIHEVLLICLRLLEPGKFRSERRNAMRPRAQLPRNGAVEQRSIPDWQERGWIQCDGGFGKP